MLRIPTMMGRVSSLCCHFLFTAGLYSYNMPGSSVGHFFTSDSICHKLSHSFGMVDISCLFCWEAVQVKLPMS